MANPLTESEVLELLAQRGVVLPVTCPACNRRPVTWGALDAEILALPIQRYAKTGRHGSRPGDVRVVAPTCGGCGYMLFFDLGLPASEG